MRDKAKNLLRAAQAIQADLPVSYLPPAGGTIPKNQPILPHVLVVGTRGYIEKLTYQINGCYTEGWFDACAVMMRRLLETLIIETYEAHSIESKIKNTQGDYLYLRDLIAALSVEKSWTLSRNSRKALPDFKSLGDLSAHSRRFIAVRQDIDRISIDFRVVCQELLYLSGLK